MTPPPVIQRGPQQPLPGVTAARQSAAANKATQVLVKNTFLQVDALRLPEEGEHIPAVNGAPPQAHLRPRGESCDAVLFGALRQQQHQQQPLVNFNDILSCIPENKGTCNLRSSLEQTPTTHQRLLGDEEGSTTSGDRLGDSASGSGFLAKSAYCDASSLSPTDLEQSLTSFEELKKMPLDELPVPSHEKTTIMLRNIPNKYTQVMLLENLDKEFQGLYDFFYLPIDFKNKCNVGYAFINFVHPFYAEMFAKKFAGRKLTAFKSKKVCDVSWGRVQGLRANIEHYRNSPIMSMPDPKYKPLVFKDGILLPFPGPAHGQIPAVKARCRGGGSGGQTTTNNSHPNNSSTSNGSSSNNNGLDCSAVTRNGGGGVSGAGM